MCFEIKVIGAEGVTIHNGDTASKILAALGYQDNQNLPKNSDYGLEIRIAGRDGLTEAERIAIDSLVSSWNFKNAEDFAIKNGYENTKQLAEAYSFSNVKDFFLADGWYERLTPLRNYEKL